MNKVEIYSLIKNGKITEALKYYEDILKQRLDEEAECGIKVIRYVLAKVKNAKSMGDPHKVGDALVIEWKNILSWVNMNECTTFSEMVDALKYYIFSLALKHYESVINNNTEFVDIDLMVKLAKCYREIGEVDRCIDILEDVRGYRGYDSSVLANLADAYFELGDVDRAKLFYREAFFWDPQEIEIFELKSIIIKRLIKVVKDHGYSREEINEWIPIYGVIENVFDIRRELSKEEVNKIIVRVKMMEEEYMRNRRWVNILEPRLINSYIWLVDYYAFQEQDIDMARNFGKIIQKFSPNIYNKLKLGVYAWL